jgi:hypothetical protein
MATWRPNQPAGATEVPVGAGYIRENWSKIEDVLGAGNLAAGTPIDPIFDTGAVVKQWFYLNAAPTNWTEIAAIGDELLAVKGGTTYIAGEASAGTWQQTDATLDASHIPAHTHTVSLDVSANSGSGGQFWAGSTTSRTSSSALGGVATASHNHSNTWRPAARVGILCSFD